MTAGVEVFKQNLKEIEMFLMLFFVFEKHLLRFHSNFFHVNMNIKPNDLILWFPLTNRKEDPIKHFVKPPNRWSGVIALCLIGV